VRTVRISHEPWAIPPMPLESFAILFWAASAEAMGFSPSLTIKSMLL